MQTTIGFSRLSCLPVSFYPEFATGKITIGSWAAIAKAAGLDAVDLSVLMIRPLGVAGLRTACAGLLSQNVPVDTLVTYTDFTHPDAVVREQEYAQFQKDIRMAKEFGAKYVRITAGQAHPDTARAQGLNWAASFLGKAADYARRQNIGLLFENHSKPGVWQYYDFAGPPDVYFDMIEQIKDTGIDLLFDVANALVYRQEPLALLEKIFPRVRRIHLNDIKREGFLEPVALGTGVVDFSALFAYLRTKKYSGGLSIEEASCTGHAGLMRAVQYVRKGLSS